MRLRARRPLWAVIIAATAAGCAQAGESGSGTRGSAPLEQADEEVATVLSFGTMVGVEGGFVKHNRIRGVTGDELPWEVASADGSLSSDGHLRLEVTGVVFADYPPVPEELQGINDEEEFRALVSCLSDDGRGRVETVNLMTEGFPANEAGDSSIDAMLELPDQCVAPIVFVMAGSEDFWFTVTGVAVEEDERAEADEG